MTEPSPELDLRGAHGIFGGTFDPIHLAHLAVAEAARDDLGLASVTFIPAGVPPHKVGRRITAAHHRAAMVEAAIADNPGFRISRVEIEREGPSYTVDTLERLVVAGEGPLALIMSMDSYLDLPTWREPERVLDLAALVVAPRDGVEPAGREFLAAHVPGAAARVVFLAGPHLRLSASELRDRAAVGRSLRYLVPDAVAAYIGDHGLYRDRVDARTRVPARDPDDPRRMDRS